MIKTFYILLVLLFLTSCISNTGDKKLLDEEPITPLKSKLKFHEVTIRDFDSLKKSCLEYDFLSMKRGDYDLRINNDFDFSLLTDSIIQNTKSVIVDYDTVPIEFNKFKELERLKIGGIRKTILKGIILPKLIHLETWGTLLETEAKLLNQLIYLEASKSNIIIDDEKIGLNNLKSLRLHHSTFKGLDFTSLKSISNLFIGAYRRDSLDLRRICLDSFPCLTDLNIYDDYGTVEGVPKGIENVEWKSFYVYNKDLNPIEKAIVDSLNKINF